MPQIRNYKKIVLKKSRSCDGDEELKLKLSGSHFFFYFSVDVYYLFFQTFFYRFFYHFLKRLRTFGKALYTFIYYILKDNSVKTHLALF